MTFTVRRGQAKEKVAHSHRDNSISIGMRWEKACYTGSWEVFGGYLVMVGRTLVGDEALSQWAPALPLVLHQNTDA